jgi:hypothetical protein
MKISALTTIAGAVFMTLLASSVLARDHSILNGTWTLVPAKSEFSGQPVMETGTVTISDHESVTVVTRSFQYEGAAQTFFYNDSTGTEFGGTVKVSKELKTRTRWDHDVLKVTTTQSGAVTTEDYTLAADGAMVCTVDKPGHKTFILRFERK